MKNSQLVVSKQVWYTYTIIWARQSYMVMIICISRITLMNTRGGVSLVQISVAIIAVAFVALVIYLILALRSVRESMEQANQTMANLERQLEQVSGEAMKLMISTTQLTDDMNRKIKHVDGFFESINDVGQAVQQVTSSVKQVSATVSQSFSGSIQQGVHTHKNKIDEVVQWTNVAINLWQKLSSLKSKKEKE